MGLRLFVFIDGDEIAAFPASAVPRAGETLWLKTLDTEATVIVDDVEHQLDRSSPDTYGGHDVCLYCRRKN